MPVINQNCLHVLLTLKKAIDSVLHSALLLKLAKLVIKCPFYDIIRSMYRENDLHVQFNGHLCSQIRYTTGRNLQSKSFPNLFKIFINDLPNIFSERDDQVELEGIRISSLLYADDLILLSISKSGLQSKKISNDQELIQSDPISCPQNQKGNN